MSCWLILIVVLTAFCVQQIEAPWPSSNASSLQLLGLFLGQANGSQSTDMSPGFRAMFKAAVLLSQQYGITIDGQLLSWQTISTSGNAISALDSTCQAVSSSSIVGIVGPGLSREAHMIAPFAEIVGIPMVSYGATDPDLSNRDAFPALHRTVPSDNEATESIAQLFVRFNWTSCIFIHQNDQFGSGGVKALGQAFDKYGLLLKDLLEYDINAGIIRGNLKERLLTSATRLVVVWAQPSYISAIVQYALALDVMGPQFTWILSQSISLASFNQTDHSKLLGLLTVEPSIGTVVDAPVNTTLLNAAYEIWQRYEPESFPGAAKVNQYALFTFDATWSLILSLQQFCSQSNRSSPCLSFNGPSYCFNRRLLDSAAIFNAVGSLSFLGVSGPVQFANNITDRVLGSYYLTRNAQPSTNGLNYVPVLQRSSPNEWEVYGRTNLILWPGHALAPPTGRAALVGIRLRIGVIEVTPFTTVTDSLDSDGKASTKLIGYVPDLINHLQSRMGFIPEIILAPPNQTYTGLVRAVANGVYDIVVGDVTILSTRREMTGFSSGIFDNSLRIIVRKESMADVDLLSYLKPFSLGLWMMLLAACVCAAILFCLLERQKNIALQHRSTASSVAMSMWYSIGTIMGYGADFHASTAAGRMVTVSLYLMSLVIVATYTANLASELTVSKSKNIISGIDDIKNGKIPFSRFGIRVGTASEELYLREISDGNRNFYPLTSRKDMYEKLLSRVIDASLMDTGIAEYVTNSVYCNLTLVGTDFDKSSFGIVIPKQWLYAQELDVNILLLREAGTLDELKRKWFQSAVCSASSEERTGIRLETMSGLFLTFAIICVISLMFMIYEKRRLIKNYVLQRIGVKTRSVRPSSPARKGRTVAF